MSLLVFPGPAPRLTPRTRLCGSAVPGAVRPGSRCCWQPRGRGLRQPAPGCPHSPGWPGARHPQRHRVPRRWVPRTAIRLRRPDFARPASVAAAFFTAWASIDTRDSPDAGLRRCAHLITPALKRQLAAGQTAPAGWQAMRAEHLVSVVHVQAVTHPAGAPPPRPGRVYLRVYAQRMTTTSAGRTVTSDGITLLLVRHHGRWLVARLLFY